MNDMSKNLLLWIVVAVVLMAVFRSFTPPGAGSQELAYSSFIQEVRDGRVGKVSSCIECIQPYVYNINLIGTHGTIKNNQIFSKTKYPGQTSWASVPTILPDSGDVTHHPFSNLASHLIDCIQRDVESHANIADAFKSHELCYAADLSGLEGKPVALPLA